jgi:hypothetical protein
VVSADEVAAGRDGSSLRSEGRNSVFAQCCVRILMATRSSHLRRAVVSMRDGRKLRWCDDCTTISQ